MNLGMLGASTVVTLLLVEAILHAMNIPPERADHQRLFVEHDSLRGWRNVPNARGYYTTDEYSVYLRYNSRGFRGKEVAYDKPAGTYRVLVLGDSFVEGYSVALEERVTEVLQELLSRRLAPRRVEVIAMGTAGYSTDQELLWLSTEGFRYEPDIVVLLFHPNDVWYNTQTRYSRGFKPRFVRDGDSLVLTNVPVPLPSEPTADGTRDEPSGLTARSSRWLRARSKLYWLAANAIKRSPRLHAFAVRRGLAVMPPAMVFDAGDRLPVPVEFTPYREELSPEAEESWRVTQLLLARLKNETTDHGTAFLAFFIPLRGAIYTQELAVRSQFGHSADGWDPRVIASRFLEVCVDERIECIDATDEFLEVALGLSARGERLYYRHDWHWNRVGHRLAAGVLADRIVEHTLAP